MQIGLKSFTLSTQNKNMENQSILESLNVLENTLKEVNAAKEQVEQVTSSAKELSDIISMYKESLDAVAASISGILKDSKDFNLKTLDEWSEKIFEVKNEAEVLKAAVRAFAEDLKEDEKNILETFKGHVDKFSQLDLTASFERVNNNIESTVEIIDSKIDKRISNAQSFLCENLKSFLMQRQEWQDSLSESVNNRFDNLHKAVKVNRIILICIGVLLILLQIVINVH